MKLQLTEGQKRWAVSSGLTFVSFFLVFLGLDLSELAKGETATWSLVAGAVGLALRSALKASVEAWKAKK